MKKFLKVLMVIAGIITAFLIYVQFTYKQKFDAPSTGIRASSDSAVIGRGKYLVLGGAHCYACHVPDSLLSKGLKEPLIGGKTYKTPFANFNIPNITPDNETGIGRLTDEEIAQAIRYNVNHRGEAMVGFMAYNNMSNEDITAIVSYLRVSTPVIHEVPDHDYNMLGKLLMRFLVKPKFDVKISELSPDSTAEYGRYLAYDVAQCHSCHTQRDKIGAFVGQPFAGGNTWIEKDGIYTSPNLTPDDSTGRITHWTETVFIQRFKAGKMIANSPMPWDGYQKLNEVDIKALYRYLKTLPPSKRELWKTFETTKTEVASN